MFEKLDMKNLNQNYYQNVENFKMDCQILRSAGNWSVGLDKKNEVSILNAYYDLIDNAKYYILIENQFFISKSYTDEENVNDENVDRVMNHLHNQYNIK
jgi:phospholipase D1/2